MPLIPFPVGLRQTENVPKSRQSLTNCFNTGEGAVLSRPGIEQINTTGRVARGQFVWRNALYQVASTDLIKYTDINAGTFEVIGTIEGNARIEVDIGFTHAVIVVRGGNIYSLDASDTLATLFPGSANYEASNAVTFINDRFVFIPTDGTQPAFFTNAASLDVDAANFFDAQELPDRNQTTFNLRNTLYIAGTDSFELFRDTGATPVPFSRLTGARMDYGYIGGLQEYADTFAFIGRERDQDFGIYLVGQGRANKISNEAIDVILAGYTLVEMANAVSNRFKWRGYDILTFTLARDSFAFLRGEWFLLSVLVDGEERPWNAGFINQFAGSYYSASDNLIGRLSSIKTEYGLKVPRIIDIPFQDPNNDFFACQSVELNISQGFNGGPGDAVPGTVGLAASRNNVEYGELFYRDLGALGDYSDHAEWNPPGGLGIYNGFMGLRIYTTQPVEFNANALFANFRADQ